MGHSQHSDRSALLERYATGAGAVDAAVDRISDDVAIIRIGQACYSGFAALPTRDETIRNRPLHQIAGAPQIGFLQIRIIKIGFYSN